MKAIVCVLTLLRLIYNKIHKQQHFTIFHIIYATSTGKSVIEDSETT